MPPPERLYCAQQIDIPPELPDILKQFAKAAIRTQPPDALRWAAAYFSALSRGDTLPVKDRLEVPAATQRTDTGLTPGLLKVLHKQLGTKETVTEDELRRRWKELCLPSEQLEPLLELGGFGADIGWMRLLAVCCSALGGTIVSALKHACEVLTQDPEGGPARIPVDTLADIYTYLAHLDGEIPQEQIDGFLHSMQDHAKRQGGMVQPTNFTGPYSLENIY